MAFISCKLTSAAMATKVDVQLYFPCDLPAETNSNEIKGVLTLLHGYTNTGDDWIQFSSCTRYAADNGLVLIIPSVGNSFYSDMVYGSAAYTFITQEMPYQLSQIFKIPSQRDKNFIAGLSMGGYGALKIGLSQPTKFAGCASFSGAVDVASMLAQKDAPGVKEVFTPIFGETLELPDSSNLFKLATQVATLPKPQQPLIMCTCGKQDYEPYMIRPQNEIFATHANSLNLKFKYLEWDGNHEWYFWDKSLVLAIDYFFNNGYAAKKIAEWTQIPTEVK